MHRQDTYLVMVPARRRRPVYMSLSHSVRAACAKQKCYSISCDLNRPFALTHHVLSSSTQYHIDRGVLLLHDV